MFKYYQARTNNRLGRTLRQQKPNLKKTRRVFRKVSLIMNGFLGVRECAPNFNLTSKATEKPNTFNRVRIPFAGVKGFAKQQLKTQER